MKYVLILLAIQLTGCAAIYDNADKCQTWNKPAGYKQPDFCGSARASATYITRDNNGRVVATTRVVK